MTNRDISCTKGEFEEVCSRYKDFNKFQDYSNFITCDLLSGATLAYNTGEHEANVYGRYDIGAFPVNVDFLEDHFQHPLYPTENECLLFEIEYGVIYPLNKRNLIKEG